MTDHLTDMYASLSPRLERLVRLDVCAPDAVIEDACQFAWSRLLHRGDAVRPDAALTWLTKTAVHEAFKLIRREGRELSLDAGLEGGFERMAGTRAAAPEVRFEQAERLRSLKRLPERQQRLLWLQGLGFSYEEIARRERCTERTVERQVLRARGSLRAAEAREL